MGEIPLPAVYVCSASATMQEGQIAFYELWVHDSLGAGEACIPNICCYATALEVPENIQIQKGDMTLLQKRDPLIRHV